MERLYNKEDGVIEIGALYGFAGVPKSNIRGLEYLEIAQELGEKLYHLYKGEKIERQLKYSKELFNTLTEERKSSFLFSINKIEERLTALKEDAGELQPTQNIEKLRKMEKLAKFGVMSNNSLTSTQYLVSICKGEEAEKSKLAERVSQTIDSINNLRKQLFELGIRETTY